MTEKPTQTWNEKSMMKGDISLKRLPGREVKSLLWHVTEKDTLMW
jgi:hypothetical protein